MCKSKLNGGMGFQNLQAFNLAGLAKQGWRLISNPNSLVAQIYKARYYLHGDVFRAKLRYLTLIEEKWTVPPPGVFKIKVDGTTSENERNSSVGVVITDATDTVHVACCKYLQG